VKNRKDQQNHRHHHLSAAGSADRARITPMAEHKHPGSNSPQQNADQRRTGNPPTKTKKSDAPAANTPKSPADLAIPPDNLTPRTTNKPQRRSPGVTPKHM
jgi:hypothetical protein